MGDTPSHHFEVKDLVAVFGGEIGKDGKKAGTVCLCNVLVVGHSDLIVEDASQSTFSTLKKTHTVPKGICHKLFLNPSKLEENVVLKPLLGDFVLSYIRDRYKDTKEKNTTGILYKIEYKLGKPDLATLICGKDMSEVPYSSLIVLQQNANDLT